MFEINPLPLVLTVRTLSCVRIGVPETPMFPDVDVKFAVVPVIRPPV